MSAKIPTPTGRVSNRWYSIGYQAALIDLARCLAEGGEAGVAEWINNNTTNRAL